MKGFLYCLSIYFIFMGTIFILYTELLKRYLQKILKINVKWFFPLPLIIGILLISAKNFSAHPWFITILGIFILGKGIYLLFFPKQHIDALIEWWIQKATDTTYRFGGIIILILGIALFSWCR